MNLPLDILLLVHKPFLTRWRVDQSRLEGLRDLLFSHLFGKDCLVLYQFLKLRIRKQISKIIRQQQKRKSLSISKCIHSAKDIRHTTNTTIISISINIKTVFKRTHFLLLMNKVHFQVDIMRNVNCLKLVVLKPSPSCQTRVFQTGITIVSGSTFIFQISYGHSQDALPIIKQNSGAQVC